MSQPPPTESGDDADSAMDVVSMSQSKRIGSSSLRKPLAPASLVDLRQSLPIPNLERLWEEPQPTFSTEQLKDAMSELTSLQRYARARAVKLHKHLVEVANATNTPLQVEKGYEGWMDILRNTEVVVFNEEMQSSEPNKALSVEEVIAKRKRDEKRRRDKDRKRKKKKRSGIDEAKDVNVKPPDSLWTSTSDYFRFPTRDDLELIVPKVDKSLFDIPPLGKHFPDEWKMIDEAKLPSKKKKKSYQAITRRFRPKSDIMAITDTNVRKQIIEYDKHLKSQRGLQPLALARRCIAAVFPIKKDTKIENPIVPSTCPVNATIQGLRAPAATPEEGQMSLESVGPPPIPDFFDAPFVKKEPEPGTPKSVPIIKSFLEERVRMELKYIGLVPANKAKCIDLTKPENRYDDEVVMYLRQQQEQLKTVNAINVDRCSAIFPRASAMVGLDAAYKRLNAAEHNLEQMYKTMGSAAWDPAAATAAMDEYDAISKEWRQHSSQVGNCGSFYVPKPEDCSGAPRQHNNSK